MEKLTYDIVLQRFHEIHSGWYDYSKVCYVNSTTKVIIICNKHGEFLQTPESHYRGSNCPQCANDNKNHLQTKTNEKFIEQSKLVHGGYFDYSHVHYVNGTTKVKLICEKGHVILQTPDSHLKSGCYKCAGNYRSNTKEFIEKAKNIHGDFFNYEQVEYVTCMKPVKIVCPKHGVFTQTPNSHLSGKSCNTCYLECKTGFSKKSFINNSKSGISILYKLKCVGNNEVFFKIGITNRSVSKRFPGNKMPYQYEVIDEIVGTPEIIYDLEQELHAKYKENRYVPKLAFGGMYECFSKLA